MHLAFVNVETASAAIANAILNAEPAVAIVAATACLVTAIKPRTNNPPKIGLQL